ncbi:hypothetical protein RNZ50_19790 [Paracoccaceae bacterium Fryx2]|nr:hypothetical protein [Paracoccaceae bacterium Fryx2]
MRRLVVCLVALLALAACGAEPKWASDEAVRAAAYVHDGPPSITLFTVISNRDNNGAHSGLLINGSQRVMFDPAGTWQHPRLPERNDVHYGITPRMVDFYIDYHARETFRVLQQTVQVSPGVAELVMQRAMAYGAVPKAQCTRSVSSILRDVPGFEDLPSTWYPVIFADAFGKLPGVTSRMITDDDADNNHGVLLVQAGDPRLPVKAP